MQVILLLLAIDLDGLEPATKGFEGGEHADLFSLYPVKRMIYENPDFTKIIMKMAFPTELPKKFIDHYVGGNGEALTINQSEMAEVHASPIGLNSPIISSQVNEQIKGMKVGESRKIKFSTSSAISNVSGTLGQFTIIGEGTFTKGTMGNFTFEGTMSFEDDWDFNKESEVDKKN